MRRPFPYKHVEGADGLQPSIPARGHGRAGRHRHLQRRLRPASRRPLQLRPACPRARQRVLWSASVTRTPGWPLRNSTPSQLTVGGRRRMTANHHSRRSVRRQPGTAQSAGGGSSLSGSARCPCLVAPPEDADGGGPSTHPAGGVNIPPVLSVIVGGGIARRIQCHSAGGGTAGGKHPGRPRSRQLTPRRRQRSAGQAACPRADRSRAGSGSAPRRAGGS
jgi:hypothetical protein